MKKPTLYRRRFIPDETVCLKNDVILRMNDDMIVTQWKVLKPRSDFARGSSCYFLKEGYKVSAFLDQAGKLVYHYCDIIETAYDAVENAYTFSDLLVDVVVYENGFVKVLDLNELPEAFEKGLIGEDLLKKALLRTDKLLNIIYGGQFGRLICRLECE